jgi:UDP-glucose 4-epimerase
MTVLVTSGAGYIGSYMVHTLVDAGERASWWLDHAQLR